MRTSNQIPNSKTRLYRIWNGMKSRCRNSNSRVYKWYGAKGIYVCDEWLGKDGFLHFKEWALSHGYREDLTIDRIDSALPYTPQNCQWLPSSLNSSKAALERRGFDWERYHSRRSL